MVFAKYYETVVLPTRVYKPIIENAYVLYPLTYLLHCAIKPFIVNTKLTKLYSNF